MVSGGEKAERELSDAITAQGPGALAGIACKILMKILYAARMCRYDLLKAVGSLASRVTKWDKICDEELHRLVSYIQHNKHIVMVSYVGDSPKELFLQLYSDADFASDLRSSRSTSGTFLKIAGPNTSAPLAAQSKKQTAVSHSTPEAEIVAADQAVRGEGLPALTLWETILNRKLTLNFKEDNSAATRIIETGRNPTLRHLNRTHKVDLRFLHEQVKSEAMKIEQCPTKEMCADIFTKGFSTAEKWVHALSNINHAVLDNMNWSNGQNAAPVCGPKGPTDFTGCNRVLIEFCCGDKSKLGTTTKHSQRYFILRLTERIDMTTEAGVSLAMHVINKAHKQGLPVLLWGAIP